MMCAGEQQLNKFSAVRPVSQPQGEIRFGKPLVVSVAGENFIEELEKRIGKARKFNIPKRARTDI